jgi:hypothetical protein
LRSKDPQTNLDSKQSTDNTQLVENVAGFNRNRRKFIKRFALQSGALTLGLLNAKYFVEEQAVGAIAGSFSNSSNSRSMPFEVNVNLPFSGGIGEWKFPASWDNYFIDSALVKWKNKFRWNAIRLDCYIEELAGINGENQFSIYDTAVAAAYKYGWKVILCDFTYTGSPPSSDMTNWYKAWEIVANHYSGDTRLVMYQIANELEHSTTTNQVLTTCTKNISSIDPKRLIAWWMYSPSTLDGSACYPKCCLSNPGNVFCDFHSATYYKAGGNTYCRTNSDVDKWISAWLNYENTCGFPPICGEINAQYSGCNSTSVYLLEQLISNKIPYICWGWTAYKSNWNAILEKVTVCNPPPDPRIDSVSPSSGSISNKTLVTVDTSGWNPNDQVGLIVYNPSTDKYLSGSAYGGTVTCDSSGNASIEFHVNSDMGPADTTDELYVESTSAKQCGYKGYQTQLVSFLVTS